MLGLLAGLAPLTSILQLLMAPHAERIGYRRLMLSGWSARVVTLLFLAALPLTAGYLPAPAIIGLLIAILFVFTTLRGVATCAWLPWITAIVPRSLRGAYLSRDRMFISLATVAALAVAGTFLTDADNMRAYAVVFGLSFAGGAASLYFLNRIPEPARAAPAAAQIQPSRWRDLLHDEPFVHLLVFSVVVQVVVLSTGTFVTIFVREEVHLQDGPILWLTSGASLVGMLALHLLRSRVDRLGSRPFLGVAFLWWAVYLLAWFFLAAHLVSGAQFIAPLLMLGAGFFTSMYELALTRLLMNTAGDRPATTQYFALQSVVVSILAGLAPMLWGWLLDYLRTVHILAGAITLNGYALFFGLQWVLLGLVFLALMQVREGSATSTSALLYRALISRPGQLMAVPVRRRVRVRRRRR